jgi:hypothetical protein
VLDRPVRVARQAHHARSCAREADEAGNTLSMIGYEPCGEYANALPIERWHLLSP